jgi:hypothetical protein
MARRGRLHVWREVTHPFWRWCVLIPFAILGFLDTIRDDLVGSQNPIFHLGYWLPGWPWHYWALVIAILTIAMLLEGAYQAIKRRDDLLFGMMEPEGALAELARMQSEGRRLYNETNQAPQDYISKLQQWENEVADFISKHYSVSELHTFRSSTFFNGGEYTLPDGVPREWLEATQHQRIVCTARLVALDEIIRYGSSEFFGPRLKLAEWMEKRHAN